MALKKGIINQDERDELNKWREEMRNPYSHAESSKIIKNNTPYKSILIGLKQVEEAKTRGIPTPSQSVEIPPFAISPYIQSKIAQ